MKRLITCLLLMLFSVPTFFSQRRTVRPAQSSIKLGYYFTVDMCHACYYPNWTKDLLRLFQAQGLKATLYEGAMMETPSERFVSMKMFPRRGLWKDIVYVGPFTSEEAALAALDLAGADGDAAELEKLGAENVKRIVHGRADAQSPYDIAAFLELKTVWHPIGM